MKKMFVSFLALITLVCVSFSFVGCSKVSRIDKDGNITLQFWSIYPKGDENYDWLMSKISQFESENQKVKIQHTGTSFWDYFGKISVSQTDSKGPDIFYQTSTDNGTRANGKVSMNIKSYIDKSEKFSLDAYSDADKTSLTHDGGVYGVPYATDGRVMYYNIDLMNALKTTTDSDWVNSKAGKKYPTHITGKPVDLIDENENVRAPKTFYEIMVYAELLTTEVNGSIDKLGFDVGIGNNNIMNFAWNMGGEFFNGNNPVVDSDAKVKEAFEIWYDIANVFSVNKVNAFKGKVAGTEGTIDLFWQGKVALMIATNEVPWQNDKLGESKINLGAAPIPYTEDSRCNFSGGFSLEITNRLVTDKEDEKVLQAAYDFVEFMMSESVQTEILTQTSNMPGNVLVYDALIAEITDPVKQIVINEMSYRRPYNFVLNAPQWWGPVYENLTKYVAGSLTLDASLSAAQKGIKNIQQISGI